LLLVLTFLQGQTKLLRCTALSFQHTVSNAFEFCSDINSHQKKSICRQQLCIALLGANLPQSDAESAACYQCLLSDENIAVVGREKVQGTSRHVKWWFNRQFCMETILPKKMSGAAILLGCRMLFIRRRL
jgi:hypothetical protein